MLVLIKRWLAFGFFNFCALIIVLSVIFYVPTDQSLLYDTTDSLPFTPWYTHTLAYTAGILLYFFGSSCLIISIASSWYAFKCMYPQINVNKGRLSALCALVPVTSTIMYRYSLELCTGVCPGGTVGAFCSRIALYAFDEHMVNICLFFLLWSLLIIVVQFSFAAYSAPLVFCIAYIRAVFVALGRFIRQKAQALKTSALQSNVHEGKELTIYEDPFWGAFIKPAVEVVQEENKQEETIQPAFEEKESEALGADAQLAGTYTLPQPVGRATQEVGIDKQTQTESEQRAKALEHKLERFGIQGKVSSITYGPVVTLFEYQPSIDTKISNILAREDDLALALQALSLRIIAPIPGKSVIGFEVAHSKRRAVLFSELLQSNDFVHFKGSLPLILGKDTLGANSVIDLATAPHLLVAGSTGSGKSVGLHAMLMSLFCSKTPQELRCILIDPKRLEFSSYTDIAHLLFPIVTDPARALSALRWAVKTMEDRYTAMAQKGVRNIGEYNSKARKEKEDILPFIVIVIDELADLMMTAGKDIEHLLARLAQMARAAGIHMITATQRPSVDVITGLIKVNFPSRIAFKVTSKVDSRTIIDMTGAEKLLGKGDMLFLDAKGSLNRVHGALVTEEEINAVVQHIKAQQAVDYVSLTVPTVQENSNDDEDLFNEALSFIAQKNEISISLLQRAFRIGYNRSARLIDQLESQGYIMPTDGSKMRRVVKKDL